MINPEMVVLAREYRNFTQEQLARAVLTSQATIAKIEGGLLREGDAGLLERIAAALKFPTAFFQQEGERLGFGSSSLYYRKRVEMTAGDRKRISGVVNLLRMCIKRMLLAVDLDAARKLPWLPIDSYGGSAQQVARAVRSFWNLPEGPIANLTALIESAGVIIIPCDFGTRSMDATSLKLNDAPPMIFISKAIPGDRWRFTLAHELAHLVMHDTPHESMEDEADAFAAEFLMPAPEMEAQFSRLVRLRIQDLANLKPYWKVSMGALLMRASSLGRVTAAQSKMLWSQFSKLGYRLKEPVPLPVEKTQNFGNLFEYFKTSLGFTTDEIAETVHLFSEEFESLGVEGMVPKAQKVHHLRAVQ